MILDASTIPSILTEINSDFEKNRRQKELENLMIYEGQLHLFVEQKLKEMYPKTWSCYNVADYNIHKKITDKKSKSYLKPPIRSLDQEAESKLYSQILDDNKFNDTMKAVDLLFNRHKYCAVGVVRERFELEDGGTQDAYNFWALAPYEFNVHRDINGEIYAWSFPTGKEGDFHIWTLWSLESHVKIKTRDYKAFSFIEIVGNPLMANPYGLIPFIYVPDDCQGAYPYQSSLPRQTVELNTNLSIYMTSGNMQIGQLVLKYPKTQKIDWIVSGLMTAMKLEQETKDGAPPSTAEYISPSPNLDGHKESILTYMMMILDEHGMTANTIKGGEKFSSGFDRALAGADVSDIIENNQDVFTRIEGEIYEIVQGMNLRDGNFTFKSKKLVVKFARPKILSSDSEKLDNLAKKKALGLWEEWQLLQDVDPNLTEEEAKKIVFDRASLKALDAGNVFNGAQVSSLVEVVVAAATKQMPIESAVNILISSFGMTEEQARKIVPNDLPVVAPVVKPFNNGF